MKSTVPILVCDHGDGCDPGTNCFPDQPCTEDDE
jgi:hypothetical protein